MQKSWNPERGLLLDSRIFGLLVLWIYRSSLARLASSDRSPFSSVMCA
jgi:hypothetical protein